MKSIDIYTEGEIVLIQAKVDKVHIEKDRETYELCDMAGDRFKHRFTKRDIYPLPTTEEKAEEDEELEDEVF